MSDRPRRHGPRFWLAYALAWIPGAAAYAVLLAPRIPTAWAALRASLWSIVPAAILGAGAWLVADRLPMPRPVGGRARFVAIHFSLALVYTALWALALLAAMALRTPPQARHAFVRYSLGWQLVFGVALYGLVAGIASAVRVARDLGEQEAARARAEALRARAELQALRAQLDPHFLFNTLHSLTALVRHDPGAVERALERFGDLLRYVLRANRDQDAEVPLADELAFVRNYLELESLRLGARLRVVEAIDPEALDCAVPAFTLQPLVENAVRHGIAPRPDGGTLRLAVSATGEALELTVADDGPGTDLARALAAPGLGLRLVGQRLRTLYGAAGRCDVVTRPGGGFAVHVSLPERTTRAGAGMRGAPLAPASSSLAPLA